MLIDWCDTLHFDLCAGTAPSRARTWAAAAARRLIVRAARAQQHRLRRQGASSACTNAHPGLPGWHGRRLVGRGQHAAGAQPPVEAAAGLPRASGHHRPELGADVPFSCGGNAGSRASATSNPPWSALPAALCRHQATRPGWRPGDFRATAKTRLQNCYNLICCRPTSFFFSTPFAAGSAKLVPEIGKAIDWLASKGLQGRMTGSKAVFAPIVRSVAGLQDGRQHGKSNVAIICGSIR